MGTTATLVTVFAALWIGFSAFSVFTHQSWVVDNFVAYGVPRPAWPWLGTAKLLGALGLLVGLWMPTMGMAAAAGLVLYFIGAVITVLHARAWSHVPFPLLYLAPAAAAGLLMAQA